MARAYAKRAKVKTPSVEEYEAANERAAANVIPFPTDVDVEGERILKQMAPAPEKRERIRIVLPVSPITSKPARGVESKQIKTFCDTGPEVCRKKS